MLKINKDAQSELILSTMEELVPQDSVFRKINKHIDFSFIYDEVKELYCFDMKHLTYKSLVRIMEEDLKIQIFLKKYSVILLNKQLGITWLEENYFL